MDLQANVCDGDINETNATLYVRHGVALFGGE
jgi:hypothetical protein